MIAAAARNAAAVEHARLEGGAVQIAKEKRLAMLQEEIRDRIQKLVHPFRITKGEGFRLEDFDPGDTGGITLDKAQGAELVQLGTKWLAEEQDMLYAQDRWSLLLIFQAMDAAGPKTARSSTSCLASIPKDVRYSHSSSPQPRSSITTSCGATSSAYPSADVSVSSTVPTTKRCSSCGCIPRS